MSIGRRIKARREELRLTQRELAARLGYKDHTTLARIETGKTDPPQSRIVAIAEALGVSPGYLLGGSTTPEGVGALAAQVASDPKLLQLVEDYLMMDVADRAAVGALVSSLSKKKKG
jgi:transcriptional regulator with XRE-family HTH domain